MSSKRDQSDSMPEEKPFMRFYVLTFELVVLNLILILGGYYLDSYLSSSPIAILIGTLLGIGGTIWILLRFMQ